MIKFPQRKSYARGDFFVQGPLIRYAVVGGPNIKPNVFNKNSYLKMTFRGFHA